jgi:hypothetical protein
MCIPWPAIRCHVRNRRRIFPALAAVALAATLTGCVSMQDSGPPTALQASPSDTTQAAANIGPIPAGPQPGLQPWQVVEGFLEASASYSTFPDIVTSYLTPHEQQSWNPQWSATVFSTAPNVTGPPVAKGAKEATVTVQGTAPVTFSGSGQYLSAAQSSNTPTSSSCSKSAQGYTCGFTLTQVDGQWRIAKLPPFLLLDQDDFGRVYQTQDLYFFDPTNKVLVPDTVFVPLGTSAQQTLTTLVCTLLPASSGSSACPSGGSGQASANQTWLTGATVTSFPPGTKLLSPVTISGLTATVNLGGPVGQITQNQSQIMAQLTWTLIKSPTPQGPITGVTLDINGNQQVSAETNTPTYEQYDPYPANQDLFTYVDNGVAEARCGTSLATSAPIFNADGVPALPACGGTSATSTPSPTPSTSPTSGKQQHPPNSTAENHLSMVAASPLPTSSSSTQTTGRYLAGVSGSTVTIWNLAAHGAAPFKWSQQGQSISSISWDRQDNLWVVLHDSSIYVLSAATRRVTPATFDGLGSGSLLSLNVAPDGVRAALIVENASDTQEQVELAGIDLGDCRVGCTRSNSLGGGQPVLVQGPTLGGPSIANAISLAWYNQDNLYVLDSAGSTSDLYEVPVTGGSPSSPYPVSVSPNSTSAQAQSIAAGNGQNVLVAGMSNGQLLISTGLNEGWQLLGPGSMPAYSVGAGANP